MRRRVGVENRGWCSADGMFLGEDGATQRPTNLLTEDAGRHSLTTKFRTNVFCLERGIS